MIEFFVMISNWFWSLWGLLDSITFQFNDLTVSYGSILFAVLATAMVISIFWRGAKA